MTTNTTTRGSRTVGTISSSPEAMAAQFQANRMLIGMPSSGDKLVLQGKYVVNPDGLAEVVVSVNQKAFKQKMVVREINGRADGRPSNESITAVSIGSL